MAAIPDNTTLFMQIFVNTKSQVVSYGRPSLQSNGDHAITESVNSGKKTARSRCTCVDAVISINPRPAIADRLQVLVRFELELGLPF